MEDLFDTIKNDHMCVDGEKAEKIVVYKECMTNYEACKGGYVTDGCQEFMQSDENELTCAACGCHRNFHKKNMENPSSPYHSDAQQIVNEGEIVHTGNDDIQDDSRVVVKKKRFRTKFTREQKMKMLEFAEKNGWKIQGKDKGELNNFCMEIGVRRKELRVWLNNNKNTHRRKGGEQSGEAGEQLRDATNVVASSNESQLSA